MSAPNHWVSNRVWLWLAVLGLHAIKERPVAVNGKVEIRPVCSALCAWVSYEESTHAWDRWCILLWRMTIVFLMDVRPLLSSSRSVETAWTAYSGCMMLTVSLGQGIHWRPSADVAGLDGLIYMLHFHSFHRSDKLSGNSQEAGLSVDYCHFLQLIIVSLDWHVPEEGAETGPRGADASVFLRDLPMYSTVMLLCPHWQVILYTSSSHYPQMQDSARQVHSQTWPININPYLFWSSGFIEIFADAVNLSVDIVKYTNRWICSKPNAIDTI